MSNHVYTTRLFYPLGPSLPFTIYTQYDNDDPNETLVKSIKLWSSYGLWSSFGSLPGNLHYRKSPNTVASTFPHHSQHQVFTSNSINSTDAEPVYDLALGVMEYSDTLKPQNPSTGFARPLIQKKLLSPDDFQNEFPNILSTPSSSPLSPTSSSRSLPSKLLVLYCIQLKSIPNSTRQDRHFQWGVLLEYIHHWNLNLPTMVKFAYPSLYSQLSKFNTLPVIDTTSVQIEMDSLFHQTQSSYYADPLSSHVAHNRSHELTQVLRNRQNAKNKNQKHDNANFGEDDLDENDFDNDNDDNTNNNNRNTSNETYLTQSLLPPQHLAAKKQLLYINLLPQTLYYPLSEIVPMEASNPIFPAPNGFVQTIQTQLPQNYTSTSSSQLLSPPTQSTALDAEFDSTQRTVYTSYTYPSFHTMLSTVQSQIPEAFRFLKSPNEKPKDGTVSIDSIWKLVKTAWNSIPSQQYLLVSMNFTELAKLYSDMNSFTSSSSTNHENVNKLLSGLQATYEDRLNKITALQIAYSTAFQEYTREKSMRQDHPPQLFDHQETIGGGRHQRRNQPHPQFTPAPQPILVPPHNPKAEITKLTSKLLLSKERIRCFHQIVELHRFYSACRVKHAYLPQVFQAIFVYLTDATSTAFRVHIDPRENEQIHTHLLLLQNEVERIQIQVNADWDKMPPKSAANKTKESRVGDLKDLLSDIQVGLRERIFGLSVSHLRKIHFDDIMQTFYDLSPTEFSINQANQSIPTPNESIILHVKHTFSQIFPMLLLSQYFLPFEVNLNLNRLFHYIEDQTEELYEPYLQYKQLQHDVILLQYQHIFTIGQTFQSQLIEQGEVIRKHQQLQQQELDPLQPSLLPSAATSPASEQHNSLNSQATTGGAQKLSPLALTLKCMDHHNSVLNSMIELLTTQRDKQYQLLAGLMMMFCLPNDQLFQLLIQHDIKSDTKKNK